MRSDPRRGRYSHPTEGITGAPERDSFPQIREVGSTLLASKRQPRSNSHNGATTVQHFRDHAVGLGVGPTVEINAAMQSAFEGERMTIATRRVVAPCVSSPPFGRNQRPSGT